MSKPSRRPAREARKAHQAKVKAAHQRLASQQKATEVVAPKCQSMPNRLSPYQSVAEEQAAREEAVAAQISVYRNLLPGLSQPRWVADLPTVRCASHSSNDPQKTLTQSCHDLADSPLARQKSNIAVLKRVAFT